ncbi:hypothetical protein EDC04DRAFT_3089975 [Pisolithus marmoratus]|nr:hypothetical protein EDC04DRAFT_3089975 [Pisolithus marmoratus]
MSRPPWFSASLSWFGILGCLPGCNAFTTHGPLKVWPHTQLQCIRNGTFWPYHVVPRDPASRSPRAPVLTATADPRNLKSSIPPPHCNPYASEHARITAKLCTNPFWNIELPLSDVAQRRGPVK